jgi:hypothetical protein
MKRTNLRRLVALVATTGLAVSLAACGREDAQHSRAPAALAAAPAAPAGWSMSDLASVDPAFLGRDAAPLPEAVPMRASSGGSYGYAPAYDYGPEPYRDDDYVGDSGPDDYQWLALASALGGMLGYAPPDYAFGYDGVQPWAWETGDRYLRYAEPIEGGYRYYYYEPDSYSPFLVSDPYYSYGYRDDRLVVVYDRAGRLIDARRADRQRRAAMDYFARAQALYRAGHRDRHYGVSAALWRDHRDDIARAQRRWDEARRERPAWQGWDASNERRLHRDWAGEALVRRGAERSFAGWQKADFRTPAPRFYSDRERHAQLQKVAAIRSSPTFAARQEARQHEQRRNLAALQRQAQQQRVAQHQRQVEQQQADRRRQLVRREDAMRQQQHQQQVRKATRQQAAQSQHAKAQQAQKAAGRRRQAMGQAHQAAQQRQRAQHEAQQRRQQAGRAALRNRQEASRQAAQRREHAQAEARSREQQAQSAARQRHARQAAEQRQAQAQATQRHARQARAEQQSRRAQAQHAAQQRQAQVRQATQRKAQEARPSQPSRASDHKDGGGGHGRGRG